MQDNKKRASATKVLEMDGDLTIENVQELHQKLLTALDQIEELAITFEKVTAVDLAFVQLLCAAHRTAVKADKTLKLAGHCPEALITAVRELGFLRETGCILDTQGSCLWKEGWE